MRSIVDYEEIDHSVYTFLSHRNRGAPLFPALRELSWTIEGPCDTSVLLLVVPSLKDLTLVYSPENHKRTSLSWVLERLIHTVCIQIPRVQSLYLKNISHPWMMDPVIQLDQLTALTLLTTGGGDGTYLTPRFLHALSSMNMLAILSIRVVCDMDEDLPSFPGLTVRRI